MKRFGVTCFLTFRCNYACPYCPQFIEKTWADNSDIDGEHWIRWFKKLPPSLIHFTGGEPFYYRDFFSLIKELPSRHLFYIASNLSAPIERLNEFLDTVNTKQLLALAVSLHPSQKSFRLPEFERKIRMLVSSGVPIFVNFVAYPPQIYLIPKLIDRLTRAGALFNVDPFLSPDYFYSEQEQRVVDGFVTQRRKLSLCFDEEGFEKLCSAGMDYVTAIATGDVYRCTSGFFVHDRKRFYLGNLIEGVDLNKKAALCSNMCQATCDQNMVTLYDMHGKVIWKPLYQNDLMLSLVKSAVRHSTLRKLWTFMPQRKIMNRIVT